MLKSLSPAVLQSFINMLFNSGFSRNTLSVIKGILTGSLNYAIEPPALIQTNPMIGVKLPSVRAKAKTETNKKDREIVTEDQMKIILKRFPIFHSCHLPLQLAYRCGMRLGEVFALTWDDINLENGTIDINKQVQNLGDSWVFSNPKYDSSRTIKIDNSLIKILELYKERQYKSKCLYEEYYKQLYVDNERRINTDKNGKEIHLINIRHY